jgi:hypothetical protein
MSGQSADTRLRYTAAGAVSDHAARYRLAPGSRRGDSVYVRVVRFTDVTPERVEGLVAEIDAGGPPPGVPIKGLQMLFDEGQGTAVVLQLFDSAEDMGTGGEAFAAMDPSETPGTRASVDMCELKLERRL